MKKRKKIIIQGVHIPFSSEKDGLWMTPDWVDVFEYYPKYFTSVLKTKKAPFTFHEYMLEVCNQIDKVGLRKEYDKKKILSRCFEHYGLYFISGYAKKYKDLVAHANETN